MMFSREKYEEVCRAYNDLWFVGDNVLYALCKRYPSHQDRAGVNAKLWLIGRAYASGIERKIKTNGAQSNAIEQLDDFIWKNRNVVDEIIGGLREITEPLTTDKLARILDAHGRFVNLLKGLVRPKQTPRSFASKYLHFHIPALPILDSIVDAEVRRLYRRKRPDNTIRVSASTEPGYADFIFRFWQLYQDAEVAGAKVNVKRLDNYLLGLAKERVEK